MKKKRFDIMTVEDLRQMLLIEGLVMNDNYRCIEDKLLDNKIIFRVKGIEDLIQYLNNIALFEELNVKLFEKISKINKLIIRRLEYERVQTIRDDVSRELLIVNKLKNNISERITESELGKIIGLEKEIGESYLFSKDIELLKKVVINKENVVEEYDYEEFIKTLIISIPKEVNYNYISVKKGSLEYHNHLKNNIPRLKTLILNLDKYLIKVDDESEVYELEHSKALQDSINIAIVTYNNRIYKAISGGNEITGYCNSLKFGEEKFKSYKVNKLGDLGIGYNRINDSEKKIIEYINTEIENNKVCDSGELIIYSKWEPCPSCYCVINQFMNKYPNIKIKVKYKFPY